MRKLEEGDEDVPNLQTSRIALSFRKSTSFACGEHGFDGGRGHDGCVVYEESVAVLEQPNNRRKVVSALGDTYLADKRNPLSGRCWLLVDL